MPVAERSLSRPDGAIMGSSTQVARRRVNVPGRGNEGVSFDA